MRSEHVRLASIALLACTLLACNDKQAREALPDWSDGYDVADGGIDAGGQGAPPGGFSIVVADDVQYPHRLYEEGRMDAPCAVDLGDDSHNDIRCMLDMDELDLFVLGFKLNIVTPVGGCDYVLYEPYIYESWPAGAGPTEVSYKVHADGTFSDEVNSANGRPLCDTDYSRLYVNGPNCCTGTYTLTVTSADSGESSVSKRAWDGDTYPDCYDGGGWLLKGLLVSPHAFPPDPIYYVDRKHQVIPIEEQGFSDRYVYHDPVIAPTNVQLANYWNLDDGTLPNSLHDYPARPDYTFTCLDDAQEVLARIRLQVREWNEEVQFDTNGDPDKLGTELKFPSPVNDILDWKDIVKIGSAHNFVTRVLPGATAINQDQQDGQGGQGGQQ